jgi:ferredoxin-nitrite reductase
LAFLIDEWGIERFRQELERRVGDRLLPPGRDARTTRHHDHLGISRQKESGLCTVGLSVPVGRITSDQMFALAHVSQRYGTGDIRITTSQNVIIPNVPEGVLLQMTAEPLLRELRHDPSDMMRGVVSCTGIDYCHMALIETKELALKTARELDARLASSKKLLTMHWSGCPAGCGNHTGADIGLLGKNVKIGDEIVDAVDVFVGGRSGPNAKAGTKILEDVPCSDLPRVLEQVIPYATNKRATRNMKKEVTVSVAAKA